MRDPHAEFAKVNNIFNFVFFPKWGLKTILIPHSAEVLTSIKWKSKNLRGKHTFMVVEEIVHSNEQVSLVCDIKEYVISRFINLLKRFQTSNSPLEEDLTTVVLNKFNIHLFSQTVDWVQIFKQTVGRNSLGKTGNFLVLHVGTSPPCDEMQNLHKINSFIYLLKLFCQFL